MYFYATINANNMCVGVSQLGAPVQNRPDMIQIPSFDESYLLRYYIDGQWQ